MVLCAAGISRGAINSIYNTKLSISALIYSCHFDNFSIVNDFCMLMHLCANNINGVPGNSRELRLYC